MRAWQLIRETVFRRSYILITHIVVIALWGLLFLVPVGSSFFWGKEIVAIGGFVLPLVLSAGVFGDDVASGRIGVLIATPTHAWQLYSYRLLGLSLQGLGSIIAGCALVGFLHALTQRGSIGNLVAYGVAAWLLFVAVATVSTTCSIVLKRGQNSLALGLCAGGLIVLRSTLSGSDGLAPRSILAAIRYCLPPAEVLALSVNSTVSARIGAVGLVTVQVAVYGLVGVFLLRSREFPRSAD